MAAADGSRLAVLAAIGGNGLVMCAKFVGFGITGSGVMLSEAIHTFADLLNQILLWIGIARSERGPDKRYPYGYGAERYVWALISAVGIFFLGCGVTAYHGVHALLAPEPLHYLGTALIILAFSLVIEAWVLWVAVRGVQRAAGERPFFDYLRHEADPASVAVILEDFAACLGVIIALVAIGLAKLTGLHIWDALGTLLVSLLLGGIAVWLIQRNRQLLVGPAVPRHVHERLVDLLRTTPAVEEIVDLRTRVLDAQTYRVQADLRFDGEALAARLEDRLREAWEGLSSYEDFRAFAARYADQLMELLAEEIDRVEQRIREHVPRAVHLDLEADIDLDDVPGKDGPTEPAGGGS